MSENKSLNMSRVQEVNEMHSMDNKRKSEFAHVSHYGTGSMDRETAALARSGKKQVLKVGPDCGGSYGKAMLTVSIA